MMRGWPEGVGRLILDEVDSTNSEARRQAKAGASGPLWIMAHRQSAGRGRRGNRWDGEAVLPTGNLYATLLMRPQMSPMLAAQHSFVAALSVGDLISCLCPQARVEMKWPNDVLLNGGKTCGILLESEGSVQGLDWMAVGIGVNLVMHPHLPDSPAFAPTDISAEGGVEIGAEEALTLLAGFFDHYARILALHGFEPIRLAWREKAARIGQEVIARLPRETITGIFTDLDAEGSLVLDTPEGRRYIPAAEVFFP